MKELLRMDQSENQQRQRAAESGRALQFPPACEENLDGRKGLLGLLPLLFFACLRIALSSRSVTSVHPSSEFLTAGPAAARDLLPPCGVLSQDWRPFLAARRLLD